MQKSLQKMNANAVIPAADAAKVCNYFLTAPLKTL
jgi:hypothetical protein